MQKNNKKEYIYIYITRVFKAYVSKDLKRHQKRKEHNLWLVGGQRATHSAPQEKEHQRYNSVLKLQG